MTGASEITRDIANAGLKTAPPVAVSLAARIAHLSLADWVAVATLIYVVLQSAHLLWKWFREWRDSPTPTPH